jgi:predicted Zn finger-like uncharacterized protein
MSLETLCPNCGAVYRLVDQVAGRKVRCKACQQVFTANPQEGEFPEVIPVDDDPGLTSPPPPPRPRPRLGPADLPRVRRGKRRRVDVSFRPFPWPLLAGGIVAGLVLLVGLAGAAAWLLTRTLVTPVADASPVANAAPAKAPEHPRPAPVVVAQRPPFPGPRVQPPAAPPPVVVQRPPVAAEGVPVSRGPVTFPPPVPVVLKPPALE